MDFMLFTNRNSLTYWQDWKPVFQRVILNQFFDWVVIALIGGAIVGALTEITYRSFTKRKSKLARIPG